MASKSLTASKLLLTCILAPNSSCLLLGSAKMQGFLPRLLGHRDPASKSQGSASFQRKGNNHSNTTAKGHTSNHDNPAKHNGMFKGLAAFLGCSSINSQEAARKHREQQAKEHAAAELVKKYHPKFLADFSVAAEILEKDYIAQCQPDETYKVGEMVERRDHDEGSHWAKGYVTDVNPLMVTVSVKLNPKEQLQGFRWDEVRKMKKPGDHGSLTLGTTDMPSPRKSKDNFRTDSARRFSEGEDQDLDKDILVAKERVRRSSHHPASDTRQHTRPQALLSQERNHRDNNKNNSEINESVRLATAAGEEQYSERRLRKILRELRAEADDSPHNSDSSTKSFNYSAWDKIIHSSLR